MRLTGCNKRPRLAVDGVFVQCEPTPLTRHSSRANLSRVPSTCSLRIIARRAVYEATVATARAASAAPHNQWLVDSKAR